jgi:hypothetical protein
LVEQAALGLGVLLAQENDPKGGEAAYRQAMEHGDTDAAEMAGAVLKKLQAADEGHGSIGLYH